MSFECVTFDAAGTLVDVRWDPVKIALEAAQRCGIQLDEQTAGEAYQRLLATRWGTFRTLNLQRREDICNDFWYELGKDWLEKIGVDSARAKDVYDVGDAIVFSPDSGVFQLYEDSHDALDAVEKAGLRMAVISNWDISLHRVLRMLGIYERFEVVVASLEEGVEKPDTKLFEITLDRLGLPADSCLHVGDDPLADGHGARSAGMSAVLIDRNAAHSDGTVIRSLGEIAAFL
ncbi:HAD-IA family hydrolase [Geitlerinema splendidum]|nr:HAD-IA family hydrolase [Geitlerinema splendidum]